MITSVNDTLARGITARAKIEGFHTADNPIQRQAREPRSTEAKYKFILKSVASFYADGALFYRKTIKGRHRRDHNTMFMGLVPREEPVLCSDGKHVSGWMVTFLEVDKRHLNQPNAGVVQIDLGILLSTHAYQRAIQRLNTTSVSEGLNEFKPMLTEFIDEMPQLPPGDLVLKRATPNGIATIKAISNGHPLKRTYILVSWISNEMINNPLSKKYRG